jgi:hypothetical protein
MTADLTSSRRHGARRAAERPRKALSRRSDDSREWWAWRAAAQNRRPSSGAPGRLDSEEFRALVELLAGRRER